MPESPLLIIRRLKSWPISVGQEKRCDGGPAKSQGSAQVSVFGGNPADGGWSDSRRAPARGLRRGAAGPQPVFQSIQFAAWSLGIAPAAARGGPRAGPSG